jgi:hypothetical protein
MVMTTEKQRAANRRNAQRSTGPRTEQGKARSRWNALKHGAFARQLAVDDPRVGEDAAQFEALRRAYLEQLRPVGELERLWVERIALHSWRLKRSARCEAARIRVQVQNAMGAADPQSEGTQPTEEQRDLAVGATMLQEPELSLLLDYEREQERGFGRAFRQLLESRRGRADQQERAEGSAGPAEPLRPPTPAAPAQPDGSGAKGGNGTNGANGSGGEDGSGVIVTWRKDESDFN